MVHGRRQQAGNPVVTEAEGSSASPTAATSESPRKGKKRLSGPLSQLILQAFESSANPRKGVSLAALKKFLREGGYNLNRNKNSRLKRELHNLVSSGVLVRVTGSGASGSFKYGRTQAKKKSGKAETKKLKKSARAKKPSAGNREPKKKSRKKQPAVNKPKGVQRRRTAVPSRKR
ncbi:histone H1C-like [Rhineura floridana]|uniref:histone H1C-like n=1 Tax=Rhineura floridana TaxID=261503 RepID=UPI002AC843A8|nr:histone H1C-like [Rhineura floridana]